MEYSSYLLTVCSLWYIDRPILGMNLIADTRRHGTDLWHNLANKNKEYRISLLNKVYFQKTKATGRLELLCRIR
jgi:hypothetical protein